MFLKVNVLAVRVIPAIIFVTTIGLAVTGLGNSWSLSGDMQVTSNPSPSIRDATWEYLGGNINNNGGTISPGNSSPAVHGIPEPSTLLLFIFGGCLFWLTNSTPRRR